MRPCAEKICCVLVALGFGLILSLLLPGCFVRVLVVIVLLVLGCLLSGCA